MAFYKPIERSISAPKAVNILREKLDISLSIDSIIVKELNN